MDYQHLIPVVKEYIEKFYIPTNSRKERIKRHDVYDTFCDMNRPVCSHNVFYHIVRTYTNIIEFKTVDGWHYLLKKN